MRGRRSRLGYLLALVALCLQLAAPVLPAPQVSSAAQDEFAAFLRLHALCLGGDAAQTAIRSADARPIGPDRPSCRRVLLSTRQRKVVPGASEHRPSRSPSGSRRSMFPAPATTEVAAHPVTTPRARAPPKEA